MKLAEQKTLLADVRAITDDALKLYNAGVKISGVVQKLRAVGDELDSRVRYIEKHSAPVSAAGKPKIKAPKPETPAT
jgi:hypothetical protein